VRGLSIGRPDAAITATDAYLGLGLLLVGLALNVGGLGSGLGMEEPNKQEKTKGREGCEGAALVQKPE
jgi:hypothetical protein